MRKKSLGAVALVLCCALIILPVLSSIAFFIGSVSGKLENTARETVDLYISQFTERTQTTLDALRSGVFYLTADSQVRKIMHSDAEPEQLTRLVVEEGIARAMFASPGWDQRSVTGIYLIKDDSTYLSVLREGFPGGTEKRVIDIYKEFQHENSARSLVQSQQYPDFCYFIVDYLDLETMRPIGKIIFELSAARLVNTQYLDALYHEAVVALSGLDGHAFYITGDGAFDAALLDNSAVSGAFLTVGGREYYHSRNRLGEYHLKVDVFVPKSEIFNTVNQTVIVYVAFALLVLVLTLLAGMALYTLITKPLHQMVQKIDLMATGDLSARMDATPYKETQRVVTAFNSMADRLDDLFGEVYEKGMLLREAEFTLLESQIRPHFIFNVLEVINMRCMEAGQNDICRMVTNLAQLLRSNIAHKNEQKTTFEQEMRYVRYYLELQKERFADSLNYEIELEDEELLAYYLPKLTIQPLVENSVVHGLENKRGGGTVRIQIWEEETDVCVRVSDDGIGFDATQLTLDAPPKAPGESHNHVALCNINRRIQLLYGKDYGMHVVSAPGKGTEIMLTLPIDTKSTD